MHNLNVNETTYTKPVNCVQDLTAIIPAPQDDAAFETHQTFAESRAKNYIFERTGGEERGGVYIAFELVQFFKDRLSFGNFPGLGK